MPARLRPTAPIATDAILVGDPGRALLLAQELLAQPKMSNHARGLWGYSGRTEAGHELTIQSTGMGGPSAAVVLHDLAELGVRRAVRIGTCVALDEQSALGELVVVREAHHLGEPERVAVPDPELTATLAGHLRTSARQGAVASLDSLHRPWLEQRPPAGEVADMQTATLLDRGEQLGISLAAVLVVGEAADRRELEEERLEDLAKQAGAAAAAALSPSS
jgi:uridine phosphorylase